MSLESSTNKLMILCDTDKTDSNLLSNAKKIIQSIKDVDFLDYGLKVQKNSFKILKIVAYL